MSLLVTHNQHNSHVVGKSDSNIHTNVPNLPPKLTPLLPPKQMINKSREDVNKINKDIMRKSSQQIFIKGLNPPKKKVYQFVCFTISTILKFFRMTQILTTTFPATIKMTMSMRSMMNLSQWLLTKLKKKRRSLMIVILTMMIRCRDIHDKYRFI